MKTILVPTDFSQNPFNAAKYALKMATEFNARIILLHVFQLPLPVGDMPLFVVTENDIQTESLANLKIFKQELCRDEAFVAIELMAVMGDNAMEIEKVFKAEKADIIIMGTKGKSRIAEVIIGSTTHALFSTSRCPILAIPNEAHYKELHKVIIANENDRLRKIKNEGVLQEIITHSHPKTVYLTIIDADDKHTGKKLGLQESDEKTRYFRLDKNAPEAIRTFAEQHRADIIVMYPHHHGFWESLFKRGNTDNVSVHSSIPVLAIPA